MFINVFAVIVQNLYGFFLYLVSVRNATANAICIPQIDQISLWGKGHTRVFFFQLLTRKIITSG